MTDVQNALAHYGDKYPFFSSCFCSDCFPSGGLHQTGTRLKQKIIMSGIRLRRKIHTLNPYHAGVSGSFIVGFTELKKHLSSWAFLVLVPPVMGNVGKGCFPDFTDGEKGEDQTVCLKQGLRWLCITAKCYSLHAVTGFGSHSCLYGLGSLLYLTFETFIAASF